MKEITLQVNGRKMIFLESELVAILEKHFSNQTVGSERKVNPATIKQKLFDKKRKDLSQERTRLIILEAFKQVKCNPKKYARTFKVVVPEKTWTRKTVKELIELASNFGDHIADWVEQALEWAQRISDGESWDAVCNEIDNSNCCRLVVWKNGHTRRIGGSLQYFNYSCPATNVSDSDYFPDEVLSCIVPLVVTYTVV